VSEGTTTWRSRLAAPALAALMVACCLAAPLIVGAAGALTAGALFGIGAGAVALLIICLWVARRLRSDKAC
jgi:Na+/proline symporter